MGFRGCFLCVVREWDPDDFRFLKGKISHKSLHFDNILKSLKNAEYLKILKKSCLRIWKTPLYYVFIWKPPKIGPGLTQCTTFSTIYFKVQYVIAEITVMCFLSGHNNVEDEPPPSLSGQSPLTYTNSVFGRSLIDYTKLYLCKGPGEFFQQKKRRYTEMRLFTYLL